MNGKHNRKEASYFNAIIVDTHVYDVKRQHTEITLCLIREILVFSIVLA